MSSCLYLKCIKRIHFTWQNHIDFDTYLATYMATTKSHKPNGTVKNLLLLNKRKSVNRLCSLTMGKVPTPRQHIDTGENANNNNLKILHCICESNYNFHSTLYHVANQNKFARNFDIPLSFICFSIIVKILVDFLWSNEAFTSLLLFATIWLYNPLAFDR